jgi:hypothetical protein
LYNYRTISRIGQSKRLSACSSRLDRPAAQQPAQKNQWHPTLEGRMDVDKLLERVIAQNDVIIRQNEKLLLLLSARMNRNDEELLTEVKRLRQKLEGTEPAS